MGCEARKRVFTAKKAARAFHFTSQIHEFRSVDEDEIFVLFGMQDREKKLRLADEEEASRDAKRTSGLLQLFPKVLQRPAGQGQIEDLCLRSCSSGLPNEQKDRKGLGLDWNDLWTWMSLDAKEWAVEETEPSLKGEKTTNQCPAFVRLLRSLKAGAFS